MTGNALGTKEQADLTSLPDGQTCRIVGLTGGSETVGRLEAMGLRTGALIVKKSSSLRRGPIVVGSGRVQIALAYSIAKGVQVEPIQASA